MSILYIHSQSNIAIVHAHNVCKRHHLPELAVNIQLIIIILYILLTVPPPLFTVRKLTLMRTLLAKQRQISGTLFHMSRRPLKQRRQRDVKLWLLTTNPHPYLRKGMRGKNQPQTHNKLTPLILVSFFLCNHTSPKSMLWSKSLI